MHLFKLNVGRSHCKTLGITELSNDIPKITDLCMKQLQHADLPQNVGISSKIHVFKKYPHFIICLGIFTQGNGSGIPFI